MALYKSIIIIIIIIIIISSSSSSSSTRLDQRCLKSKYTCSFVKCIELWNFNFNMSEEWKKLQETS